jgi:O-Antigen ligase
VTGSFFDAAARPAPRAAGRTLAVGLATVALALSVAVVLGDSPPPAAPITVLAGLAGLAMLALALARYEAAAALGFLLFGVVFVEPSPPDAVFVIVMAVALVTGRFTLRSVPFPMLALVVLFLALNLISAMFAVFPGRAVFFFSITAYLCFFALWLTGYVNSERRAASVVRPLVAGAVASAAVGVAVLFLSFPGKSLVDLSDGQRARGFFKDPNVFGPFLVVVALIVLSEILEPRLLRSRLVTKLGLLLVLSLGILFAYSRAAWLNAVVGVAVMLLVYSLRRGGSVNVTKIMTAVAVALAAASVVLAATGSSSFLQQRAHRQSYDSERFAGQERGLELAQHHPLGIGPGQFERTVGIASHSTYVRALAEQGVLGLGTVLGLLLGTLALATANAVRGRDTFGIGSAPLLGAWVGMMANSAFVDTLHWRQLWLVAALIWVGAMRSARSSAPAY